MKKLFGTFIVFCIYLSSVAQIALPHVFSDNMVLQRNIEIPVWGTANPNTSVTVIMAKLEVTTVSDNEGKWFVKLPHFEAGGPYELSVFETKNKKSSVKFQNVLIGDVWIASGQSNMEFELRQTAEAKTEIAQANNDKIRFIIIPHNKSIVPQNNTLDCSWKTCDSLNVKTLSAVGYYFAKKLVQENGVPIGILQSTWGGTPVEAWTSREMLLTSDLVKDKVLKNDSVTEDLFIKDSLSWIIFWDIVYNPKNGTDTTIPKAGFDDSDWREVMIPGSIKEWEPEYYEGMVWLRKKVEIPNGFINGELMINLGYPELNYSLFVNDKAICKNKWNAHKPHYFSIADSVLNEGTNIITIRLAALWGGGSLNPPASNIYITNETDTLFLSGNWKYRKDLENKIPKIFNYHQYPGFLYNAMINPLVPYGIKGIIWYQGEQNQDNAYNYRYLMPLLVRDWRNRWQQGDIPFLYVQLPNYYKNDPVPSDGKWAVLRESQEKVLQLPNTGMICTIELGDAEDIHPANKLDVGTRLADLAQNKVYGMDIVATGPIYESFMVSGDSIWISFKEGTANSLKTRNNEDVYGAAIAGEDMKFYIAEAKIVGNRVVICSERVSKPVAVRYAWGNNPECNLINETGLPAFPFRTDTWKVITEE